jgi:hypothetical protein
MLVSELWSKKMRAGGPPRMIPGELQWNPKSYYRSGFETIYSQKPAGNVRSAAVEVFLYVKYLKAGVSSLIFVMILKKSSSRLIWCCGAPKKSSLINSM